MTDKSFAVGFSLVEDNVYKKYLILGVTAIVPSKMGILLRTEDEEDYFISEERLCEVLLDVVIDYEQGSPDIVYTVGCRFDHRKKD